MQQSKEIRIEKVQTQIYPGSVTPCGLHPVPEQLTQDFPLYPILQGFWKPLQHLSTHTFGIPHPSV